PRRVRSDRPRFVATQTSCTKSSRRSTSSESKRTTPNVQQPASKSDAYGNARGSFQFAPAHPRTFDRAENRFPDAVTQHRPINQSHRQDPPRAPDRFLFQNAGERGENHVHRKKYYDERQNRPPCAERQRNEQEQIHGRCDCDENDLKEPNARQTEPPERAIVPVENHVAMFPKTLERTVGPAKSLSRES